MHDSKLFESDQLSPAAPEIHITGPMKGTTQQAVQRSEESQV